MGVDSAINKFVVKHVLVLIVNILVVSQNYFHLYWRYWMRLTPIAAVYTKSSKETALLSCKIKRKNGTF